MLTRVAKGLGSDIKAMQKERESEIAIRTFRYSSRVAAGIGGLGIGLGVISQLVKVDPKIINVFYVLGLGSAAVAADYAYTQALCRDNCRK